MLNRIQLATLIACVSLTACQAGGGDTPAPASNTAGGVNAQGVAASGDTPATATNANGAVATSTPGPANLSPADANRVPNEMGRIPVVEYHLIGDADGRYARERSHFRRDLELIYARGYRPVTIAQVLDRKIDLPRGLSPVVFVFDDASPGQFKYIERNGKLEIDPGSGVGIWLDFKKTKPDWANAAVFCMLSGAAVGRSFFGEKDIEGQKSAWRFPKVKFLADNGFELCDHTLWHANLSKYSDAVVQEQIARGVLAIDSAVPGYKVRTFALPLGVWPKNRALAKQGSWTDPKSGKVTRYNFDAILEVSGGPTESPYDPRFNPLSINRIEVFGTELEKTLDRLDKNGTRYVSDGNPATVAKPAAVIQ